MDKSQQQLEDLTEIRKLMERSSRFISLSGLSGVAASVAALIGAGIAYFIISDIDKNLYYSYFYPAWGKVPVEPVIFLMIDALITFSFALAGAFYYTRLSARKKGLSMWDATARRLIINICIPLFAGGIFCIMLLYHGAFEWIAPATLIFYGLALIQGSHYTIGDIRYLGFIEIIIGFLACLFLQHGLLFWTFGFGILHIVYGIVMFRKYGQ